jgi:hypothetical protein
MIASPSRCSRGDRMDEVRDNVDHHHDQGFIICRRNLVTALKWRLNCTPACVEADLRWPTVGPRSAIGV